MTKYFLVLLLCMFIACSKQNSQNNSSDGHGHSHKETVNQAIDKAEKGTFQITLFSDSTEYFIEYSPLIKNEKSEFLIHLTHLSNYKPHTEGKVSIIIGNQGVATDKILRPGIFKLRFQPKTSGKFAIKYNLKINNYEETVTDSVIVFDNQEKAHEVEQKESSGAVTYLKEQVWKNNFMVKRVSYAPFESVISTSGEMLAMPGEKQNVAAKSTGILLFASKKLVQGSRVQKGQLLFTISGQDITENNIGVRYSEAKNKYLRSKSEYERHQILYKDKIISEKQFIESQTKFQTDSSVYFSLSASVSVNGHRICAPLSGYLHELNVSEGQYVETGLLLATISTNKVILLRADLPQQHFNKLQLIKTANFRPAYSSKTYKIEDLDGNIIAKGASVAENNHYMPIYFKVQNDGSLLEGAFAEFYLITKNGKSDISVPNTSLIEEQGKHYVYVQLGGESYLKKLVEIGDTDGIRSSIKSGLESGDLIVTKGAMLIKIASSSNQMPAHNHEH